VKILTKSRELDDLPLRADLYPIDSADLDRLGAVGLGHPLTPIGHRLHEEGNEPSIVAPCSDDFVEQDPRWLVVRPLVISTPAWQLLPKAEGMHIVIREHDRVATETTAEAIDAL
jgi:hypothetical protein